MCCINYGNFDYGQGSSGQLSQKRRPSTQRAAWYAHNLFCPVEFSLMFAPSPSFLELSTHLSLSCQSHSGLREAFIARPCVLFLLATL